MPDRILFVDDEPDFERLIRQKYRKKIRAGELLPEFALNGEEALGKLQTNGGFAVVLTDINMPIMDGLRLLSEINKLEDQVLVVIISAYGDMENIRTAMNRGAFDFLTKPIDFDDLEITRQKALKHVVQLRERVRLQEEKRRLEERNHFIKDTFGRYLSDAVVQTLLDSPDGLKLGGEKREVTVLMSDLRGFSPLAESLPPEQVVAMLNHYFGVMIDIVVQYGGTIDELIGDSMLVMFGAPLRSADDAQRAVACAIAMQLGLEQVNERNQLAGLPEIAMGVGINTGQVVVGNIGSQKRAKYGIVGSHVNLASRIESRTVGGQVLISESTLARCGSIVDVGEPIEFVAKGFEKPIEVREVHGIGGKFDLQLPVRDLELARLARAEAVRYTVVSGGECHSPFDVGELVGLSLRGAELRAPGRLELATSLKLQILGDDGEAAFRDVYCKVIETRGEDRFVVCFTSLPTEVREHFAGLLS